MLGKGHFDATAVVTFVKTYSEHENILHQTYRALSAIIRSALIQIIDPEGLEGRSSHLKGKYEGKADPRRSQAKTTTSIIVVLMKNLYK